jgi:hypothetical protein
VDPDPEIAFYLNVDLYPNPGSQNNADLYPGQTLPSQNVEFCVKNIQCVICHKTYRNYVDSKTFFLKLEIRFSSLVVHCLAP